jgi:hypothetical protein
MKILSSRQTITTTTYALTWRADNGCGWSVSCDANGVAQPTNTEVSFLTLWEKFTDNGTPRQVIGRGMLGRGN